jgi:hypothetical protein
MKHAVILGLVALTVAACGRGSGREEILFDGQRFRGSAKAVERADRSNFVATARPVTASLQGAALAAEYEAIQHCLRYYGTSEIDWTRGPDSIETGPVIDGDSLVLTGVCRDILG